MRIFERIDNFLEKVDISKVIKDSYKLDLTEEHIQLIKNEIEYIREVWKDNPDWRFIQVLINTKLLQNYPGFYYYKEDENVMLDLGYGPREIFYWGTNYDKEMNLLPKTVYKLIKDLDTDHIKAILDGKFVKEGNKYYDYFINELKLRNE